MISPAQAHRTKWPSQLSSHNAESDWRPPIGIHWNGSPTKMCFLVQIQMCSAILQKISYCNIFCSTCHNIPKLCVVCRVLRQMTDRLTGRADITLTRTQAAGCVENLCRVCREPNAGCINGEAAWLREAMLDVVGKRCQELLRSRRVCSGEAAMPGLGKPSV